MNEEEMTPRDQLRQSVRELREEMRAGKKAMLAALTHMETVILEAIKRRNDSHDALDNALDNLNARVTKLENRPHAGPNPNGVP